MKAEDILSSYTFSRFGSHMPYGEALKLMLELHKLWADVEEGRVDDSYGNRQFVESICEGLICQLGRNLYFDESVRK